MDIATATDVGRVRSFNEDAVACLEVAFSAGSHARVILLADGMGGRSGGSTASHVAIESACAFLGNLGVAPPPANARWQRAITESLLGAVSHANNTVRNLAADQPSLRGMGTTLVIAVIVDGWLGITWLGDSRVYVASGGVLAQLTRDHTWDEDERLARKLTEQELLGSPYRGKLTQGIGLHESASPGVRWLRLSANDLVLACSDGLSAYFDGIALADLISSLPADREMASSLVRAANEAGGGDNISVVLARVRRVSRRSLPEPEPVTDSVVPARYWPLAQVPQKVRTRVSGRLLFLAASLIVSLSISATAGWQYAVASSFDANKTIRDTTHRPEASADRERADSSEPTQPIAIVDSLRGVSSLKLESKRRTTQALAAPKDARSATAPSALVAPRAIPPPMDSAASAAARRDSLRTLPADSNSGQRRPETSAPLPAPRNQ